MFQVFFSGGIQGMNAFMVRVEADVSNGLPGFEMVGSLSGEVKEARERVRVSLKNAGYPLPVARITVNLSPAQVRKEGTGYDLAIAAAILSCMGVVSREGFSHTAFLGELALNGDVHRVDGALPIALALRKQEINRIVVPLENTEECLMVPGMEVIAIKNMHDFLAFLNCPECDRKKFFIKKTDMGKTLHSVCSGVGKEKDELDFSQVNGQESMKRAACIAAAGFHHLLFTGPPGAGKTMIARRIPGILPPLTKEEQLEVMSIYSIAGKPFTEGRPFQAPHHTISPQALAGGGRIPKPGILSLSHRGILFLDEMPEFSSAVLEVLRQPLEEKRVQIARTQGVYRYPADFMLVCALNVVGQKVIQPTIRGASLIGVKGFVNRESGVFLLRFQIIKGINFCRLISITQHRANYYYNF